MNVDQLLFDMLTTEIKARVAEKKYNDYWDTVIERLESNPQKSRWDPTDTVEP